MAILTFAGIKTFFEPVLKWFGKKYLNQPKIYFVLSRAGGQKTPLGFSDKNQVVDGVMHVDLNSIQYSQIITRFKLSLRNNSEHPAYFIKLLRPNTSNECSIKPAIDPFLPIVINGFQDFELSFQWIYEGRGQDAADLSREGTDYFKKNTAILEYRNVGGTKFYTEFDNTKAVDEKNKFYFNNPLERNEEDPSSFL